jgi:endonuclease/exonuclease/phosphatase family metal-dependent hydrolase
VIISGDFNNTAYSWIYKNIKHNMKDSYLESGSGFGKTFNFKRFPLRIDFILADKIFQINEHKNYTIGFSDHFPIMVKIGL